MSDFENREINGIHMSRYIASWSNCGYDIHFNKKEFIAWLLSIEINGKTMTKEEANDIYNYATNGKLELQELAKEFNKSNRIC